MIATLTDVSCVTFGFRCCDQKRRAVCSNLCASNRYRFSHKTLTPKSSVTSSAIVDNTSSFQRSVHAAPVIVSRSGSEESEMSAMELAKREVKHEDVYAIFAMGTIQYVAIPGRTLRIDRLHAAVHDRITLNRVLLVGTRSKAYVGKPMVTNAVVNAVVIKQGLDGKIIVFKYKRKKNYRKMREHQAQNTILLITSISGYEDYPSISLNPVKSSV